MGIAALLGLLASLVGTGVSVYQGEKGKQELKDAQEKQRVRDEQLAYKDAMARLLGAKNKPWENPDLKMPEPPDLTVPNTISGVGGAISNAASSNWAQKMFGSGSTPAPAATSAYNSTSGMPYYG